MTTEDSRLRIASASAAEMGVVRSLFREYQQSLGIDLCFQSFEEELAGLPGRYQPPAGEILLAWHNGESSGVVAMRPLEEGVAEMKRLYVRPAWRGSGLGRRLVEEILTYGRTRGYRRMRLDTLPAMARAIELYRALGFREIGPYTINPVPGALFFEIDLAMKP